VTPALSAAIVFAAALVFIALERRFPYAPKQRMWREGFFNDLAMYTLVQSYVLSLVIKALIAFIDGPGHRGRWHLVSAWPIPVQLLFFLVTHDFYIYWFHRWQHRNPILWRLHEAHHSTKDVEWLSGSRSHALEILINQSIEFVPIVLLGGAPEVVLWKGVLDALWGMYIHTNINVRSGFLQRLINGPEMHRWHHAVEIVDINFSTKLAIWDWLFGTAHLPAGKPMPYGLAAQGYFPAGYFQQLAYAFRPLSPVPDPGGAALPSRDP
jgi:sterol desaturase/sphingolipid hydroxylase (fatty acid hydroxylase superfamily)